MASTVQMSLRRACLSASGPSSAMRRWWSAPLRLASDLASGETEKVDGPLVRRVTASRQPPRPSLDGLVLDGQLLPSNMEGQGGAPREPPTWAVLNQDKLEKGPRIKLWCQEHGALNLDRHWLRDSCECELCVDPHSGQKNFGSTDVPLDQYVHSAERVDGSGDLKVVWKNDFLSGGKENHTSVFPRIWDARADGHIAANTKNVTPGLREVLWDRDIIREGNMHFDYQGWMENDETLKAGLRRLKTHGLIFLQGVPASEASVTKAATRIGNLQETLYGRDWDVRSKPEAENIAYTNSFLGLHQDMLYLHEPPRLQLLHCLENSCEGGESLFSDAHRAAAMLRATHPKAAHSLRMRKIKYHYKKHGHAYERYRPVISSHSPPRVYWSPPFQGPRAYRESYNEGPGAAWRYWVRSATLFRQLLEEKQWLYEYKMQPGECVIFDNLRVLHGRRAFNTTTGSRWLKGTYLSQDVYDSKLMALGLGRATMEEEVDTVQQQALALRDRDIAREIQDEA